jgi:hypothetical protein
VLPAQAARLALIVLALAAATAGCRRKEVELESPLAGLIASQPFQFAAAPRVVAIGDLHGDLDVTKRALRLAGAIDDQARWIGGGLVVVQTGDQLDRGDDDRAILDLFDGLAKEAAAAGGTVHVLNGNHEQMNVAGDFRYVTSGGAAAFAETGAPPGLEGRRRAFAPGGAYALKLAARNEIVIVGDTVFVHGGLLREHVQGGISWIGAINEGERLWMLGRLGTAGQSAPLPSLVGGERSPVWIRDLGEGTPDGEACRSMTDALKAVGATRLVVGHTIQETGINAACNDKVWRIDVGLSRFYGKHAVEVLEIAGGRVRPLREERREAEEGTPLIRAKVPAN